MAFPLRAPLGTIHTENGVTFESLGHNKWMKTQNEMVANRLAWVNETAGIGQLLDTTIGAARVELNFSYKADANHQLFLLFLRADGAFHDAGAAVIKASGLADWGDGGEPIPDWVVFQRAAGVGNFALSDTRSGRGSAPSGSRAVTGKLVFMPGGNQAANNGGHTLMTWDLMWQATTGGAEKMVGMAEFNIPMSNISKAGIMLEGASSSGSIHSQSIAK